MVERAWTALAADRTARSLLVVPEGEMLNYLARLPAPIDSIHLDARSLTPRRRQRVFDRLRADPPDRIVVAEDEHTGEDPELMRLIEEGYEPMLQFNGQSSTFHRRSLTLWSRAAAPTRGAARAGDRRPGTSTNRSRKVRRAERRARA